MEKLKLNYNTAIFRVCMDAEHSGRIVSRRLKAPMPFTDLVNLLLKMEAVMDAQDYPRAFQRKRQFREIPTTDTQVPYALSVEEMMDEDAVNAATGALSTFLLHILSRQNACWQGIVILPEDNRRLPFESVLQFLEVVDTLIHK